VSEPWSYIVFVVVSVVIIGVIVKYYNLSPVHQAMRAIKEIRDVIVSPNVTRTSIDGALTIGMILFTAVCVFFFAVEKMGNVVSLLLTGVEKEGQSWIFICFLIFWTSIVVIASLLITSNEDRR
jgi:hypothetical protein